MTPDPMTPPDCDLRGYGFMPLFGQRLFTSRFYTLALRNPRAGLAAQKLWWEAWQQCPAGSLPDDDESLARMADFGTDMKAWAKARDVALHGFVLCNDGRLYHKLLSLEAIDAFARRKKERDRKARMRAERTGNNNGTLPLVPRDNPGTYNGTDHETARGTAQDVSSDRTGQDRTEVREERTEATPLTPMASPEPVSAPDLLWREGVPILMHLTGKSDGQCRGLLGRLRKDVQDDCPKLLLILQQARDMRPTDPVAWITAATQDRGRQQQSRRPTPSEAVTAAFGPSLYANRFDLDAQFETPVAEVGHVQRH